MKFRVGDTVLVTGGKDKGKTGKVTAVMPEINKLVVENANIYVKHIKPMNGREGQRLERSRPLPTANVAILNNENKPDRIRMNVTKAGLKTRVFAKTGKPVPTVERAKK